MRSLYWKIFLSFWLASILIIVTTAWVTSEIAQKSSIPARERVFMDSYANAAVITFESGHHQALTQWLAHTGLEHNMSLYLLTSQGEIIGNQAIPDQVRQIADLLKKDLLDDGIFKTNHLIVSHEILSTSGTAYRLAALSEKPLSHFVQIPWAGLTARLLIAAIISGLICYLLSIYLTQPLRALCRAARSIATGNLSTRVGPLSGHYKDEIAKLSEEFDSMAEEIQSLVLSKERLLQDISHELRSPLARLQMAIALGRKKTKNLAISEFDRMELECVRLNRLISDILDYARLKQSMDLVTKKPCDLLRLIQQIIQDANFEFAAKEPRIQLVQSLPVTLVLDERLIHRALENIIRNALHYSPSNTLVSVHLKLSSDHKYVYIDISDHGSGVPDAQLETIFSPFYRVDSSREKKTGGYGLGLAIARQAIKQHDGMITAKNRKQGGLTIRITLPK